MRSLLLSALLGGCAASAASTPLAAPPHEMPARAVGSVEVFVGSQPPRPHLDVALVTVKRGQASIDDMVAVMRGRAAELGCDALVIAGGFGRNGIEGLVGGCAVYTDGPASASR
ncbi:MAG TPA: hypothetical protein VLX92_29800 [Kofleriaceae bacterium]|nr:hypothetical protein [Kofleriaceae bacterium]